MDTFIYEGIMILITGNINFNNELYEEAIQSFVKALKMKENFYDKFCKRGTLFKELGKSKNHTRQFITHFGFANSREVSYYLKGEFYNDLGLLTTHLLIAFQIFNDLIQKNDSFSFLYNDRGRIHFKLKKFELAIVDYSKAVEINPNLFESYLNRGRTFLILRQFELALVDYTRAIEIQNDDSVYMKRGCVQNIMGHKLQAIADYTSAFQINNKNDQAITNRANVFFSLRLITQAGEDYSAAIKMNPLNHQAYNNLGKLFNFVGEKEKALQHYYKALILSPENPLYLSNIGDFYFVENNQKYALYFLNKANQALQFMSRKQQKQWHLLKANLIHIREKVSQLQILQQNMLDQTQSCIYRLHEQSQLEFFQVEFYEMFDKGTVQEPYYIKVDLQSFQLNINQLKYFQSFYWRTYCYLLAIYELRYCLRYPDFQLSENHIIDGALLVHNLKIILTNYGLKIEFISLICSIFSNINLLFPTKTSKTFFQRIKRFCNITSFERILQNEIKFAAVIMAQRISDQPKRDIFPTTKLQLTISENKIQGLNSTDPFWENGIIDCLIVLTHLEQHIEAYMDGQNLGFRIIEVILESQKTKSTVIASKSSSCCTIQ